MLASLTEMVPGFMQVDENKSISAYCRMKRQAAKNVDRSKIVANRCLSVYSCYPVKNPKLELR
jgi:hypothetical protein